MRPSTATLLVFLTLPSTAAADCDFDGDLKADLFWRNTSTGSNDIWLAADATRRRTSQVSDLHWNVVGEGDFDGDGRSDLFWRNDRTGANVIWRSGDPATKQAVTSLPNLQWQVAGTGDFDGDGRSDVLWRNLVTGVDAIWKAANAATQQGVSSVTNLDWVIAGIGDFTGDAVSDVFWHNTETGANVIWRSASSVHPRVEATTMAGSQVAAIGDYDGNGVSDVLWRNVDSGANTIWWNGQAYSPYWRPVPTIADPSWQVAASGDFNGDGRDDLLWRNFYSGWNTIWRDGRPESRLALASVSNLDWAVLPFEGQPTYPLLSIAASTAVSEGNAGILQLPLPLRLSHRSVLPVRLDLDVHDAGACAACAIAGSDYVAINLPGLTIAPGQLRSVAAVKVYGDVVAEANERIEAVIYQQSGARTLWGTDVVTLLNDDANTVWAENARTMEGNTGTHPMRFQIRLSRPTTATARVDVTTISRAGMFEATAGADFHGKSATIVFPAGTTSGNLDVDIIGDLVWEPIGEAFPLALSNAVGVTAVAGTTGFIVDDEPPVIP